MGRRMKTYESRVRVARPFWSQELLNHKIGLRILRGVGIRVGRVIVLRMYPSDPYLRPACFCFESHLSHRSGVQIPVIFHVLPMFTLRVFLQSLSTGHLRLYPRLHLHFFLFSLQNRSRPTVENSRDRGRKKGIPNRGVGSGSRGGFENSKSHFPWRSWWWFLCFLLPL